MTYKKDMELLESIPKPAFNFPKTPQSLRYLLLKRFTSFLLSDYNLERYIENFYDAPLKILQDHQQTVDISRERYALWNVPYTGGVDLCWNETILLLSQFLLLQ